MHAHIQGQQSKENAAGLYRLGLPLPPVSRNSLKSNMPWAWELLPGPADPKNKLHLQSKHVHKIGFTLPCDTSGYDDNDITYYYG